MPRDAAKQRNALEESDEEEGGRAAAITSKKGRSAKSRVPLQHMEANYEDAVPGVEAENTEEAAGDAEPKPVVSHRASQVHVTTKKRPASYLDELLAQKAHKKSKKKKKSTAGNQET